MVGGGAVGGQGFEVGRGGVAFVLGEMVVGVGLVEGGYFAVSGDFGEDRGGGDGLDFAVAAGDGFGWVGPIGEEVAVHQDQFGLDFELLHGAAHGQQAGPENVETVDFARACPADGEAGALLKDCVVE